MNTKFDVIVIGSGAAGSVMSYQLARKGLKVAIVEKGSRQNPATFQHNEANMFPRVYKNSGLQTTKDHALSIAQGNAVGGSTVINNAIWLRPNLDKVLPEWAANNAFVDKDELIKIYEELEGALHVSKITPLVANKGSNVFLKGCSVMNIEAEYLTNNRNQCLGCGWCNYGCRYNRKTSMLVTYIPWAEARGAVVFDGCKGANITVSNNRATGVRFSRNGQEMTLTSDKVVVSAGAIGSSAVLLQSGISLGGRVGQKFHLMGGAFVTAQTEEEVDGFDGIGLTCVAKPSNNYVIESYFAPPLVFSLSMGGFFLTHFNRMMNYTRYADAGVMVGTDPTGKITLDKKKNPVIDIKFSPVDLKYMIEGIKKLSMIYFNGGAVKVYPSTFKIIEFSCEADLDILDREIKDNDDLTLGSAHPQGGNVMCEDKNSGVVGCDFKVHGYENLYVADTSVFPTNIRTNCQATAMAIAHYAADYVAGTKK